MARMESKMLPLGTKAADFELHDAVTGNSISLESIRSEIATVVMFICNHCPYVIHINPEIVRIVNEYQPQGISFVGISSNDISVYPADSPEKMKERAEEAGYTFPYLFDETQEIARKYDAACTPDFYVFDKDLALVYRGRMDGSSPGNNVPLTGRDLREALNAILEGHGVDHNQLPSMGCSIKWKSSVSP